MNIDKSLEQDVLDAFQRQKAKKFGKALVNVLESIKDDLISFFDFYGGYVKQDLNFALNKCYHYFREKASKIIPANSLMEMDKYIMDNYVFGANERLITSFKGNVSLPKAKLIGHVFLSNFRFLGTGILNEKGKSPGSGSLIGTAVLIARERKRQAIKRALQKGMGNKFSEDAMNIFQYHYPIIDAVDIKKKNKKISYSVKMEYEHKGKERSEILRFTITPKREKGEDKSSFENRSEIILNNIEETLLKSQTL
jgi:hypothetical protein